MDGRWFHQALERVNATQADLARHLRLAPSAVSRMMKGERQMKQLETVQIAEFLGVSPEEVLRHAVEATAAPPSTASSSGGPPSMARSADQIPVRSAARGV